jgi:hypothetical protein
MDDDIARLKREGYYESDGALDLERDFIAAMMTMLRDLQALGYSDFQTITSFLTNLCVDQPDPLGMLREITENTKLKLRTMRKAMH